MKEQIYTLISNHLELAILGLGALSALLALLCLILLIKTCKLNSRYKKMMNGVKGKNLEQSIEGYYEKIDEFQGKFDEFYDEFDKLNGKVEKSVQKVAVKRFKAFEDVGADLSYSIALLDDNNDGVILTGIYGRHESTSYAKPIDKGISRYELSDEEKEVLDKAIQSQQTMLSR